MCSNRGKPDFSELTISQIAAVIESSDIPVMWLNDLLGDGRCGVRELAQRRLKQLSAQRKQQLHERRIYRYQNWLIERMGYPMVIGVDEVGRGPIAGPVVAAAVSLPPNAVVSGLDDSKRLSDSTRRELAAQIRTHALCWAVGQATPAEIDSFNIRQAAFLAMRRALGKLDIPEEALVLVDGSCEIPGITSSQRSIVRGDSRVAAIAAASILAKVHRDDYMLDLDAKYPGYGFAQHKGYPTQAHLEALQRLGPTPEHRRTFAPVEAIQYRLFDV